MTIEILWLLPYVITSAGIFISCVVGAALTFLITFSPADPNDQALKCSFYFWLTVFLVVLPLVLLTQSGLIVIK
jgi:hypothetical protein